MWVLPCRRSSLPGSLELGVVEVRVRVRVRIRVRIGIRVRVKVRDKG